MNAVTKPKTVLVIFGATGDLAKRKLYPSIYNLYKKDQLSDEFAVVGLGRRAWTDETLRETVQESIKIDDESNENVDKFFSHFHYMSFDATSKNSYHELNSLLEQLDKQYNIPGNRIFYMAVAPEFFGTIASNLQSEGLKDTEGWTRLVIEKPFGHNLESARELNEQINAVFAEDEIYRIDHYLGKEMVQNIEVIRFANAMFEPLWNNRYISNIQITSSETLGVEDRGSYYDRSGALLDMVQNHMLQIVSLLAMDPPIRLDPDEVRSEKVKVLRSLKDITVEKVPKYFVRGQYAPGTIGNKEVTGYRSESNVAEDSTTETFVAAKLRIENHRWFGVPFYIRTGKRMNKKATKIVVQFKELPMNLYYDKNTEMHPNLLVINIQPDEGVSIILNGKKQGPSGETIPVQLDYNANSDEELNTPEAYERLLYDCMLGDATNFTHWDEVELSWKYIDIVTAAWKNNNEHLYEYEAGTMGPKESDEMLANDGFEWWPI